MTEQEWQTCADPEIMQEFLRGRTSDRKLRLFACACCRWIWQLIKDERVRNAVEVSERFADQLISSDVLFDSIFSARSVTPSRADEAIAQIAALHVATQEGFHSIAVGTCRRAALAASWGQEEPSSSVRTEKSSQALLFLDIFGNPFRPTTLDPRWLTSTVVDLARTIYDEFPRQAGGYMRMPILADALMDAGCDSDDIISHCRSEGPHVRGCWVVDLLLGKS